ERQAWSGAADDGEGLGFQQQPWQTQLRGLDHGRRRIVPVGEELTPDLVDRLDVGKVRYVGGHSDDVGDLAARRLHDRLDVLPGLARLGLSVARTDYPEFLVERHLAGDEEQGADLDAV